MNIKNLFKLSIILLVTANSYGAVIPVEVREETITTQRLNLTIGAQVKIGAPTGIGAELTFPINRNFVIRGNASYLPMTNFQTVLDLVNKVSKSDYIQALNNSDIKGLLKAAHFNSLNIATLIDWHPFAGDFLFSIGGAYNNFSASIKGKVSDGNLSKISTIFHCLTDAEKAQLGEIIKTTGGFTIEQKNKFFLTSGIGFDNSNNSEATINYGIILDVMFVNLGFKASDSSLTTTNSNNKALKNLADKIANISSKVHEEYQVPYLPLPSITLKLGIAL